MLFGLLLVLMLPGNAAPAQKTSAGPAGGGLDIMLVLDNSGSMKKNDPKFLTRQVALSFVENLAQNVNLGMVIFDQKVNLAAGLKPISPQKNRSLLKQTLGKVDYKGQLTKSPEAIERAIYELKQNGRKNATKAIIFLTDGIVDTGDKSKDDEQTSWLRNELATEAKRSDIHIYAIAFTEAADFWLIQSLALKTEGNYYRALSAQEIGPIFNKIYEAIKQQAAKRQAETAALTQAGPKPEAQTFKQPAQAEPAGQPKQTAALNPQISPQDALPKAKPNGAKAKAAIGAAEPTKQAPAPDPEPQLAPGAAAKPAGQTTAQPAADSAPESTPAAAAKPDSPAAVKPGPEPALPIADSPKPEPKPQAAPASGSVQAGQSADAKRTQPAPTDKAAPAASAARPAQPSAAPAPAGHEEPANWIPWVLIGAGGAALLFAFLLYSKSRTGKTKETDKLPAGAAGGAAVGDATVIVAPTQHGVVPGVRAALKDLGAVSAQPVYHLQPDTFRIGRQGGPNLDLEIPGSTVSRVHASIVFEEPYFFLQDNRSSNGTKLNGQVLKPLKKMRLYHGDTISIDRFQFQFNVIEAEDPASPQADDATILVSNLAPEPQTQERPESAGEPDLNQAAGPVAAPPKGSAQARASGAEQAQEQPAEVGSDEKPDATAAALTDQADPEEPVGVARPMDADEDPDSDQAFPPAEDGTQIITDDELENLGLVHQPKTRSTPEGDGTRIISDDELHSLGLVRKPESRDESEEDGTQVITDEELENLGLIQKTNSTAGPEEDGTQVIMDDEVSVPQNMQGKEQYQTGPSADQIEDEEQTQKFNKTDFEKPVTDQKK